MKEWLHKCNSEHPDCKPEASKLPKRLVSLGSSTEPRLRLVSTESLNSESIQYTTLSYCWGSCGVPGKTTKFNEASYLQAIPIEGLRTTIRDALMLSRSLNIPYLWVDALCIVQGDDDDWRAQVTNMSDIYYGSALTIAASDAEDSTGGFFAHPSATRSYDTTAESRNFFVVESSSSDLLVHVEWRRSISDGMSSILHTMGWTLQELALSHRTISFTQSSLHWRCRCAYWTESGMTYDTSSTVYGSIPVSGGAHVREPVLTWWKWIESYSARKLTVSTDRIPAICGLIKYHQSLTGATSAVGLWKQSLPQDMLWVRINRLAEKDLAPPYSGTIPSWS